MTWNAMSTRKKATMPKAKICREPGCDALIRESETYCDSHKRPERKPFEKAVRYNTEFYNTARWRNLRKRVLAETPRCVRCGASGDDARLEVHHVTPPRGNEGLFFDEGNLVPVCRPCHGALTARETGGRGRDR